MESCTGPGWGTPGGHGFSAPERQDLQAPQALKGAGVRSVLGALDLEGAGRRVTHLFSPFSDRLEEAEFKQPEEQGRLFPQDTGFLWFWLRGLGDDTGPSGQGGCWLGHSSVGELVGGESTLERRLDEEKVKLPSMAAVGPQSPCTGPS